MEEWTFTDDLQYIKDLFFSQMNKSILLIWQKTLEIHSDLMILLKVLDFIKITQKT